MSIFRKLQFRRRALLAGLIALVIGGIFWSQSRYPELDEKAMMAGEIPLSDALSFEAAYEIDDRWPLWKKVGYSTLNWCSSNKKGMIFGVLFGAAFLTLLGFMRQWQTKSVFMNSVIGMFTGAPLGVCVNCAAPIARGIFLAGTTVETTLATMLSSPTLNVIVLTMLISLFPPYIVVIKLLLTLVTILIFVPLLSRFVFVSENKTAAKNKESCAPPNLSILPWHQAIFDVGISFAKNLWKITYTTVPLMLVAGFLGVLVSHTVSLEGFSGADPTIFGLLVISIVGVFLPTPIGLDIILAQALFMAGLPIAYVAAVLFTLGIYSIYSFFIIWQTISRRVAIAIYSLIAVIGAGAGGIAHTFHSWESDDAMEYFEEQMHSAVDSVMDLLVPTAEASTARSVVVEKNKKIIVTSEKFSERSPPGKRQFEKESARKFGLYRPIKFSIEDFFPPFFNGRGVASGDFNRDGFVDVAVAGEDQVYLYRNKNGNGFKRIPVEQTRGHNSIVVALVDIDNDGWLDLYFTTYGKGKNYVLLNQKGRFTKKPILIPNRRSMITKSSAFADYNRDGYLDMIHGNWFMGFSTPEPPVLANNVLVENKNMDFRMTKLDDIPGETLTTLFSDLNMDGRIDLAVGNDFSRPDYFFYGNGKGMWRRLPDKDLGPSTHTTMSMDTADINNDGRLDLYLAQITGSFRPGNKVRDVPFNDKYCEDIELSSDKKACLRNIEAKEITQYKDVDLVDVRKCKKLGEKKYIKSCMAHVVMQSAIKSNKESYCKKIPKSHSLTRDLCLSYFQYKKTKGTKDLETHAQVKKKNILYLSQPDYTFKNIAKEMGVEYAGWSWNAKFADLDNDEFQDLYVANGTWHQTNISPNAFFHNRNGKKFVRREKSFGLTDERVVGSYVYLDMDNDGDLDIVSVPVNGPLALYRNTEQQNNALKVRLIDLKGNKFCIGCKVSIRYGSGKTQIREIKAGGGFHSFEAPEAHFGLGSHFAVQSVTVQWSDGTKSRIDSGIRAGHTITVKRRT